MCLNTSYILYFPPEHIFLYCFLIEWAWHLANLYSSPILAPIDGDWNSRGLQTVGDAWNEYTEAVVDIYTAVGLPEITRSSLTKFSRHPHSPLQIVTAYATTTSNPSFGNTADYANPCMRLVVKKLRGASRFSEDQHIPAEFVFWYDPSPVRFDVSKR